MITGRYSNPFDDASGRDEDPHDERPPRHILGTITSVIIVLFSVYICF